MLMNEITFQRKKDISHLNQPSVDSTKTIYDYILKQDTKIQLLEKDIKIINSELTQLKQTNTSIKNEEKRGKLFKEELALNNSKEAIQEIKEVISNIICTENYITPSILQLKNSFIDMQTSLEKNSVSFVKRLSQLEDRLNSNNNSTTISNSIREEKQSKITDSIYIDLISKHSKNQEILISNCKSDLLTKIIIIQKRLNEFDQDFDRLIDSLKIQFQNVNEMISEQRHDKERILSMNGNNKNVNPEIIHNIFNSMNQLKEKNQRNENIIASLSQIRKDPIEKETLSNMMANEVISLRKEINADFELINSKILNELQSQANEISDIYSIIRNENNQLGKYGNENTIGDSLLFFEQELEKKANIDQLNYALESQSKINEAFCLAYRVGRWSWSQGRYDDKGIIIWSMQNINTALDHFHWNTENGSIVIRTTGIYEITSGLLSISNILIALYLNDALIMNSNDSNQSYSIGNMILINQFVPLTEGAIIKIGIIKDNFKELFDINAESFLEIRKVF